MPRNIWFAVALALALPPAATADPAAPARPGAGIAHGATRGKPRAARPVAAGNPFAEVTEWFSYGKPSESEIEKEAPGVRIKVHDPQADEIVVYGRRRHRDFEGASPDPGLTSPQNLDAAQPIVPGIGDSCSYRSGCFDPGQKTLRSDVEDALGDN